MIFFETTQEPNMVRVVVKRRFPPSLGLGEGPFVWCGEFNIPNDEWEEFVKQSIYKIVEVVD